MIFQNEKQLLKTIKYSPTIFIVLVSIIILIYDFYSKNAEFAHEKQKIESQFTQKNKNEIKERVYEVYDFIKREQIDTEKELKSFLKSAVNNAHAIATNLYNTNKDKPKAEIKRIIKEALRDIRFNEGRGYFFVYENSGKNILLPHNKELEGKDFWNHRDAKGTLIIQDMTTILSKKDESFYEWYWFNPTKPDKQRKKLGLVRNFEPFDWFIGTGEYIDDFNKKVQERVLKHIREIRFGKNGYIFVINYDSIYLSHIRKNFIGKNAVTNNDTVKIKKVINDLIGISKNGEGYYSYIQNKKPDNNQAIKKISFVKGLNEWSWMIGTGFYEDDIQQSIRAKKEFLNKKLLEDLYSTIKIALLLIFFLFLGSIYFSKILQRKFEAYKNEIEEHISEKTQQQNIMAQQSKMAAMGEMIGNIAHQWRQPLSTISTTATGLKIQKEMDVLDEDFLLDGLEGINTSAQYLSSTIDDFRNFFKIDKKKTNFYIEKVLEKAISLVYVQFYNKDIEVIKHIEHIEVINFENELIQVVINILNNARDELLKKDTHYKKMIFISAYKDKYHAIIEIKDNAGGIPKNILGRVFEPYFTTKHQAQGTGIGLYMSQEIVTKNMNGKIEVENSSYIYDHIDYKGAIFRIKIPFDK